MASLPNGLNINQNNLRKGLQKVDLLLKRPPIFIFFTEKYQTIIYQTSG